MFLQIRDDSDDGIPRDPKRVPHHDDSPLTPPIIWLLVSILGVCALFLLYRRASRLISLGQHPLKNMLRPSEGRIRLSEEGPPAESFTHDAFDGADVADEDEAQRR